jgi:heptosyltransferase-2
MKNQIKKILFITLSNIGDVILTLPVLDFLRQGFPQAEITVMVGPRPKEIFQDNPSIKRLIVYDKQASLKKKIKLLCELKKEHFDAVIDLRNSLFGIFLSTKYKTPSFLITPPKIKHMKDRHLYRADSEKLSGRGNSLIIKPEDEEYIRKILEKNNIKEKDDLVIIAPGARSHIKRWAKEKFVELISLLIKEFKAKIVLVGDKDDIATNDFITGNLKEPILDLGGKTTLTKLAALLKRSGLVISNDSAVMHLASYLNRPIVAIFGPTNEAKYGPWSDNSIAVKKEIFCRPCEKAQCRFGTLECMRLIKVEDVLGQVKKTLVPSTEYRVPSKRQDYKRILIVRTDRVGDVLLSTPVIKALRDKYPFAYIAMMVGPYTKDIIEGNPYLDEVIIYDKDILHKSGFSSIRFSQSLKKKRFDLALVLHPTNRAHLVTFFAGIRKRIGYNRKLGFLLTNRIKHTKQLGEKHELEYNLDLLSYINIEAKDKSLFMPIRPEAENSIEALLSQDGINKSDRLIAIHPGASCPSKIWPNERFAQVADKLIDRYGVKVLIIAGPKDIALAQNVMQRMRHPAVNLAGKVSLSQLASALKRCSLFISNDSGPVHIASSVCVPVISIFGRNQKGLSPKRWGPVGEKDKVIHKEVGCIECLAHNCKKDFACLKAITVDEVLKVADSILNI